MLQSDSRHILYPIITHFTQHKTALFHHIYLFFTFLPLNLPSCYQFHTHLLLPCPVINPSSSLFTHSYPLTASTWATTMVWPVNSQRALHFSKKHEAQVKKAFFLYPFVLCTLKHTIWFSNCWQPVTAFATFCISEFNKYHGWKPCVSNLHKWGIQMQLHCVFMNSKKCQMTSHSNCYMGLGAFDFWGAIKPETDCAQRKMICMKMHLIINCHGRNGTWQPSCPIGLTHTPLSRRNGTKNQAHKIHWQAPKWTLIFRYSWSPGSFHRCKGKYWACRAFERRIWESQHLQPFTIIQNQRSDVCGGIYVSQVPLVENGTLLNKAIHLLPCGRGLHISLLISLCCNWSS